MTNSGLGRWEHDIEGVTKKEIFDYCVKDEKWQEFRLTLKGTSTVHKLIELEKWKSIHRDERGNLPRRTQVQVDNYINALKRGGQLDLEGNVVR